MNRAEGDRAAAESPHRRRQNGESSMHFLLFYDLGPDYLERRPEFRNEHLTLAWKTHAEGALILAGALADPADGAVLLFQGDSANVAENFARADPYVRNGLVIRWRVRKWTTVAGEGATTPVRPVA
jgi:uncharacterized protein YciI